MPRSFARAEKRAWLTRSRASPTACGGTWNASWRGHGPAHRPAAARRSRSVLSCDHVVAVLRRTPRGQSLHWNLDLAEDLTAPLDGQDLAEILGNLGENAVKWAASRVQDFRPGRE